MFVEESCFISCHSKFYLAIMAEFLRHVEDTEQELLLETDSEREISLTAVFKWYTAMKHKCFGIRMYKLCNRTGYTYNMNVFLGKERQNTTQIMTATCVTVRSLARTVKGVGHKLFMNNFFSYPDFMMNCI
jgi:hypothetical protein